MNIHLPIKSLLSQLSCLLLMMYHRISVIYIISYSYFLFLPLLDVLLVISFTEDLDFSDLDNKLHSFDFSCLAAIAYISDGVGTQVSDVTVGESGSVR